MITLEEWDIYHRNRGDLKRVPGVTGVGLAGPDVVALVEKITPEILRNLPEDVGGIPLKVKEVGKIRMLSELAPQYAEPRRISYRPVPGGVSVGHVRGDTGTHGCSVYMDGFPVGLSNNHVVALNWGKTRVGQVGDDVLQPGKVDYGDADSVLGQLLKYEVVPEALYGSASIDAAVYSGEFTDEILGLGKPSYAVQMEPGMTVVKAGRTSGVTTAKIELVGGVVDVEGSEGFGEARFENISLTDRAFSWGGDSGSLVLNNWAQSCGLVFAGSESTSIVCESTLIEDRLGVKFGVSAWDPDPELVKYNDPRLLSISTESPSWMWTIVPIGAVLVYLASKNRS